MEVRTVRPVNEQPPGLSAEDTDRFIVDDDDMDSNNDEKNPDHSCAEWVIECERCWTNPQKMQHKTTTNIF